MKIGDNNMRTMTFEDIKDNFLTTTKRLPIKARLLLTICLIIVVVELVSSLLEFTNYKVENENLPKFSKLRAIKKIRERKEINEDFVLNAYNDLSTTGKDQEIDPLSESLTDQLSLNKSRTNFSSVYRNKRASITKTDTIKRDELKHEEYIRFKRSNDRLRRSVK